MRIFEYTALSDSQIDYVFDSSGLYLQRAFLTAAQVKLARRCIDRLHFEPEPWSSKQHRAGNIHAESDFFGELAQLLHQHPTTRRLIGYPGRLIESYALDRLADGLDLHGGASEYLSSMDVRDISARSWVQDGKIYSLRVKVLVYLDDVIKPSDGPLTYIEGSHKAAFAFHRAFPTGRYGAPDLMRVVHARAGDAIWLNEALLHGAGQKKSKHRRRLLAFTYGPSFMSNWVELSGSSLVGNGYASAETEMPSGALPA